MTFRVNFSLCNGGYAPSQSSKSSQEPQKQPQESKIPEGIKRLEKDENGVTNWLVIHLERNIDEDIIFAQG